VSSIDNIEDLPGAATILDIMFKEACFGARMKAFALREKILVEKDGKLMWEHRDGTFTDFNKAGEQ
jgi:hypothetical protein